MYDGGGGGRAALGASVACRRGGCGGCGGCGGLAEGPVDGNGAAEAVEPLLLVEDVIDLQRVGLRLAWVMGTHTENIFGFVCVAKSASEGAAHSDISVLQVLQHKILHRDWLPVNLETVALVPGDGTGQDQQLGEQEHMQLRAAFVS